MTPNDMKRRDTQRTQLKFQRSLAAVFVFSPPPPPFCVVAVSHGHGGVRTVLMVMMIGASAVEDQLHAGGRYPPPAAARGAHGVVIAGARGGERGATPLARGAEGHGTRQVCTCVFVALTQLFSSVVS